MVVYPQVLDTQASNTLVADWRRVLCNKSLADVVVRVGGVDVPAHRVVLAARCSYFRGLFDSGMKDAASAEVMPA